MKTAYQAIILVAVVAVMVGIPLLLLNERAQSPEKYVSFASGESRESELARGEAIATSRDDKANPYNTGSKDFTINCDKDVYRGLMSSEIYCNVTSNIVTEMSSADIGLRFAANSGAKVAGIYEWKEVERSEYHANVTMQDTVKKVWNDKNSSYSDAVESSKNIGIPYYTTYRRYEWAEMVRSEALKSSAKEVTSDVSFKEMETRHIKISLSYPKGSSGKFDVMSSSGTEKTELDPYWDSDWAHRTCFKIDTPYNTTGTLVPISFYLVPTTSTNLTKQGRATWCNDENTTMSSCTGETAIPWQLWNNTDDTKGSVMVQMNISTGSYREVCMYYDNAAATDDTLTDDAYLSASDNGNITNALFAWDMKNEADNTQHNRVFYGIGDGIYPDYAGAFLGRRGGGASTTFNGATVTQKCGRVFCEIMAQETIYGSNIINYTVRLYARNTKNYVTLKAVSIPTGQNADLEYMGQAGESPSISFNVTAHSYIQSDGTESSITADGNWGNYLGRPIKAVFVQSFVGANAPECMVFNSTNATDEINWVHSYVHSASNQLHSVTYYDGANPTPKNDLGVIIDMIDSRYYIDGMQRCQRLSSEADNAPTITQEAEEAGTSAPLIKDYKASPSSPQNYSASLAINFDATVTDDAGVNSTQFESNFTGTMRNATASNSSSAFYYNTTGRPAGNYSYRWIAEDGSLTNSTAWFYYAISKAAPSISFADAGNATTPRDEMWPYTIALVAWAAADDGAMMSIFHNGTNYTDADFDPSFTNITVTPTEGGYNFTAYYPGGENWSESQSEIMFNIYKDPRNVSVAITSPTNASSVTNSLPLSATIRGDFLSYGCWYDLDNAGQQFLGNIPNDTVASATLGLSEGGHYLNVTCVNATVVMNATQYFTAAYYDYSLTGQSYQAVEFETNNTYFQSIINTTSNVTNINASLVWNGTAYPSAVTKQGYGYYIQSNVTLPLITVNNSDVTWQLFYTLQGLSVTYNTSSLNTQEVVYAYELVSVSAPTTATESTPITVSTTVLNHLTGKAALVNNVTYRTATGTGVLTGAVFNATFTNPAMATVTVEDAVMTSYYYVSFNGLTRENSTTQNISTVSVSWFNCAYGGNPLLDFYGFDERELTAVNYSLNIYISAFTGTVNKNFTANYTANESHHICQNNITSGWKLDATMDYNGLPTYEGRSYFMIGSDAPWPNRVNHYLLNTTYASQITFTVVDSGNNPVQGVIIDVERWYPESNSYNMVAMGMSGADGKSIIRLENIDAWYKFVLIRNGVVVNVFERAKLSGTAQTLHISQDTTMDYLSYYDDLAFGCTANASNSVICTVVDMTGDALDGAELKLQRYGVTAWQILCTNRGNAVAGAVPASITVVCNIDANITGKVYYYSLTMTDNKGVKIVLRSDYIGNVTESSFGATGLLLSAMLIVTLAAVGAYNPAVSLVLGGLGLIISFFMGFLAVSYASLIGMLIVIIIMALKVRT